MTAIHHITAICSDPQQNIDYYSQTLGLRLVKRTVNFDDPHTYHLYYGDNTGSPGTILTFFPFKNIPKGEPGAGQVTRVLFACKPASISFWEKRLSVNAADGKITFADPDGLQLGIVASDQDLGNAWPGSAVPAEHQLRGFYGVEMSISSDQLLTNILTNEFGYTEHKETFVKDSTHIEINRVNANGIPGAGTVHHIAFRVPNYKAERELMERIRKLENTTDPIDREYFKSVYFRIPEGILFEIATDDPGFLVDEAEDELGTNLKLPTWFEKDRASIEAALEKITYG